VRTSGTLGNPYLGIERALPAPGTHVEFGIRPSVVDGNDAQTAGSGSGVEHEEAFVPRTVHVRGAIGWEATAGRNDHFAFAARLAPTWQIVTHNPSVEARSPVYPYDVEPVPLSQRSRVLFDYAVNARLQGPNGRLAFGLAGRRAPTHVEPFSATGFTLQTNSAAEFTMMLELTHAAVQPSFALRLPIGAETQRFEPAHGSLALGLLVPFGGSARSHG
jgi:hypothetical protein